MAGAPHGLPSQRTPVEAQLQVVGGHQVPHFQEQPRSTHPVRPAVVRDMEGNGRTLGAVSLQPQRERVAVAQVGGILLPGGDEVVLGPFLDGFGVTDVGQQRPFLLPEGPGKPGGHDQAVGPLGPIVGDGRPQHGRAGMLLVLHEVGLQDGVDLGPGRPGQFDQRLEGQIGIQQEVSVVEGRQVVDQLLFHPGLHVQAQGSIHGLGRKDPGAHDPVFPLASNHLRQPAHVGGHQGRVPLDLTRLEIEGSEGEVVLDAFGRVACQFFHPGELRVPDPGMGEVHVVLQAASASGGRSGSADDIARVPGRAAHAHADDEFQLAFVCPIDQHLQGVQPPVDQALHVVPGPPVMGAVDGARLRHGPHAHLGVAEQPASGFHAVDQGVDRSLHQFVHRTPGVLHGHGRLEGVEVVVAGVIEIHGAARLGCPLRLGPRPRRRSGSAGDQQARGRQGGSSQKLSAIQRRFH